MSDDDLRDGLGDDIRRALDARSVSDDGSAEPRVGAIARRRRRLRSAIASSAAILIVVALVAVLATATSRDRTPATDAPATTASRAGCPAAAPPTSSEHVKWAPVVRWHGTTYVASPDPSLFSPKLAAAVGRTCFQVGATTPHDFTFRDGDSTNLAPGTQLFRVAGYTELGAVGARVGGDVVVFVLQPVRPQRGRSVFDFSAGVREIDISRTSSVTGARLFAVPQITDDATIARLRDAMLRANVVPHSVRVDGLTLTFVLADGAAVAVGSTVIFDAATFVDVRNRYDATQRAVGTEGVAVMRDGRVMLFDDHGTPLSVLPQPQLPVNYVGPLQVIRAARGWALADYEPPSPRPSALATDCQRWSAAGSYIAAICGPPQLADRLDVVGPHATRSFPFTQVQGGGGHLVDVLVRSDGWTAVETSGECEVLGTVYLDTTTGQRHTLPNSPESGAVGVRADGRFLVQLPEGVCGPTGAPPGVYAIDPVSLDHQLVVRLDVHDAVTDAVFRWTGPPGLGSQ